MPDSIARIVQATPAWLTDVLRRNGRLSSGEMRSLTVTGVHDQQLYSVGYYLAASYSSDAPGASPTRLFLKIPRSGPDIERNARIGELEVRMYQALANDQHDLPVIPCYDAVYDPERHRYHLLLDDLSATHEQPAWHLTIRRSVVERTLDPLRWWIGNLPEDFWGKFAPRAMAAFRDLNCIDLLGL